MLVLGVWKIVGPAHCLFVFYFSNSRLRMTVEKEKGPLKWFNWARMLQVTHFPLLFLFEDQSCRTLLCSEHASVYSGTVWKCFFCLDPCLHEPSISLGFRRVPKSPDLNRNSLACLHRELPEGPRFWQYQNCTQSLLGMQTPGSFPRNEELRRKAQGPICTLSQIPR